MLPGAAAPPEADALLDGLTLAICLLWDSTLCAAPHIAATSVVLAGERDAVRGVVPHHDGQAPHAVMLYPRTSLVARLRAMGHADVGAELDLRHDPDRIDVLLVLAGGLLVAELRRPVGGACAPRRCPPGGPAVVSALPAGPVAPARLEGVACAHCSRGDTALQHDPDGGALVCLAGQGCGKGLSLREALGHDRRPRCASPSCPREPLPQGRCAACLAAAHATHLLSLRGRDG